MIFLINLKKPTTKIAEKNKGQKGKNNVPLAAHFLLVPSRLNKKQYSAQAHKNTKKAIPPII